MIKEIENPEEYEKLTKDFDPIIGDRDTKIVFIGKQVDIKAVTKLLDDCLISEEEF